MSYFDINFIEMEDDNTIYIRAMVEDMAVRREQTMDDPEEYGPALCETRIDAENILDGMNIITTSDLEDKVKEYLQDSYVDWIPCEVEYV
jgi:hypothetical protein